ncbi:MAG TPA: divergent polysaccharide deacetylase family protein [Devosia sp.]|nr:divergent polysaccharide deacetylase family protein [Devosia sp.]
MADDLSAPLGKKKPKRTFPGFSVDLARLPLGRITVGLLILALAVPLARVMLVDDPDGGRPVAEVPISIEINTNPLAERVGTSPGLTSDSQSAEPPALEQETPDAAPQDVTPTGQAEQPGFQPDEFGTLPDLSEQTQYGVIPRISQQGRTPFSAYARASIGPEAAGGKPLIAIIVTGLGLNEAGTLSAIAELPDNVTLAFAPHGRTLARTAAAARAGGHELLVEVPMEPFDYPNSDPGPRTLLTNQTARANLDHLTWVMAQIGGYVGLINYQGARFTSSAADLGPVMEELGARGLGFVDDGSSNRSLTRQLAQANQVPYSRASIRLDTNPSRPAILQALEQLEQTAARDGSALGVISALPVSISTLKSWAAGLEERGMELVPASALMKSGS